MSTQKKKVRQDLYEKRFNLLQTIITLANQHAMPLTLHSLDGFDRSSAEGKWQAELRVAGGLSDEQLKELHTAVQHIYYLYDEETGKLACELSTQLEQTRQYAIERVIAHNKKAELSEKHYEAVKRNHDAIIQTVNKLIQRLSSELHLR